MESLQVPPPHARPFRSVLIIDGSYANIGARNLPNGKLDYVEFRADLEAMAGFSFAECWYFDHEQKGYPDVRALKRAAPEGPQFQVKTYQRKGYQCRCPKCNIQFQQKIQKGVDNGIATKMLSLVYEQMADRLVLVAGDGDFYDSLDLIKNVRHKELWVVGYRPNVSPDLQQLATKIVWIEDLYPGGVTTTTPALMADDAVMDDSASSSSSNGSMPPLAPSEALVSVPDCGLSAVPQSDPLSVFVGNIPYDAVESEVSMLFDSYGVVKAVRMMIDSVSGMFRGFAFVHFDSMDGVDCAVASSGEQLRGRKLTIRRLREHQKPLPAPPSKGSAPAQPPTTDDGTSSSHRQCITSLPTETSMSQPIATTRTKPQLGKRARKRLHLDNRREGTAKRARTDMAAASFRSRGSTVDLTTGQNIQVSVGIASPPRRKLHIMSSEATDPATVIDLCLSDDDEMDCGEVEQVDRD
ncbi:hypothetical protein, variant [Aphanomyces invadans]|uniref:Meiosis regulator and mRNA stability factor 1 n=1 Tax=Aphanomyces invadans TaxID=157072 RepID=A0A024UMD4_9STRA|nr:hypothetical protein, variant [Aphanomyces invadans]ETW06783.1 hypothetical protein, variant [Aphanomyces invadans]|eukprot:XP_008864858.1 hypothetical protein, variant [Aphanomyces invadans]